MSRWPKLYSTQICLCNEIIKRIFLLVQTILDLLIQNNLASALKIQIATPNCVLRWIKLVVTNTPVAWGTNPSTVLLLLSLQLPPPLITWWKLNSMQVRVSMICQQVTDYAGGTHARCTIKQLSKTSRLRLINTHFWFTI